MYKEMGFLPDGRTWVYTGGEYIILPEPEHSEPKPYDDAMLDVLFDE